MASALRTGKSSSYPGSIVTILSVSIKSKLTCNGDLHRPHEAPRERSHHVSHPWQWNMPGDRGPDAAAFLSPSCKRQAALLKLRELKTLPTESENGALTLVCTSEFWLYSISSSSINALSLLSFLMKSPMVSLVGVGLAPVLPTFVKPSGSFIGSSSHGKQQKTCSSSGSTTFADLLPWRLGHLLAECPFFPHSKHGRSASGTKPLGHSARKWVVEPHIVHRGVRVGAAPGRAFAPVRCGARGAPGPPLRCQGRCPLRGAPGRPAR